MALTYPCPKCGGLLKVEPALAGRVLQCGRCGQKIEAANPLQAVPWAPPKPPEILPVPAPRKMSEVELDERAERRAAARREQQGDFLFRYGAVLLCALGVAALVGIVWALTEFVLNAVPEAPRR